MVDVVHGIIADELSAELLTIEIPILLVCPSLPIANVLFAVMTAKEWIAAFAIIILL